LYGESSHYGALHRTMYCHYKNDLQLSKFLVICDPTGFIMGVFGPCTAESDDKLFQDLLKDAKEVSEKEDDGSLGHRIASALHHWISTLPDDAALGLDAGFPSAEKVVSFHVILPKKVRKEEDSFEPKDAIRSRELTRWRGVVERANRRLKVFHLLSVRYPNGSLIQAELYFHVAAILCNKYGAPLARLAEGEGRREKYIE